eukprot:g35823.t1
MPIFITGFVLDPESLLLRLVDAVVLIFILIMGFTVTYFLAFSYKVNYAELSGLVNASFAVAAIFLLDMFLGFFRPYQEGEVGTQYWVLDSRAIVRHYIRTWFIIDFVSVFPWTAVANAVESDATWLPAIQLLKLLRLLRFKKQRKTINDWMRRIFGRPGAAVFTFLFLMILVAHWLACIWGSLTRLEPNWSDDFGDLSAWYTYTLSLYWSVMTITTIGYGDITPVTHTEYWVAIFGMSCGATLWAYIFGSANAVLAAMHKDEQAFEERIDDVEAFCRQAKIPDDLRDKVTTYVERFRYVQEEQRFEELRQKLSPALQAEIAEVTDGVWIRSIFPTWNPTGEVLAELSAAMVPEAFTPFERISDTTKIYVIRKGVVWMHQEKVLCSGQSFGVIPCILGKIPESVPACLTYVLLSSITRENMKTIMEKSPETRKFMRKFRIKLALKCHLLELSAEGKRGAALFQANTHKGQQRLEEEASREPPDGKADDAVQEQMERLSNRMDLQYQILHGKLEKLLLQTATNTSQNALQSENDDTRNLISSSLISTVRGSSSGTLRTAAQAQDPQRAGSSWEPGGADDEDSGVVDLLSAGLVAKTRDNQPRSSSSPAVPRSAPATPGRSGAPVAHSRPATVKPKAQRVVARPSSATGQRSSSGSRIPTRGGSKSRPGDG